MGDSGNKNFTGGLGVNTSGNVINILEGADIDIANETNYTAISAAGGNGENRNLVFYSDKNSVNITGGNVNVSEISGSNISKTTATVTNNSVNISGGTVNVTNHINGGMIYQLNDDSSVVSNNKINISGGDVTAIYIEGGNSETDASTFGHFHALGTASENEVNITEGNVNVSTWIQGGVAKFASNNKVNITGGNINSWAVYGGSGKDSATGNEVNISTGTINFLYGGLSANGDATNNKVKITGGTINGAINGGFASQGSANNNVIDISENANVEFESSYSGINGGYGETAENNEVNISGGTVNLTGAGIIRGSYGNTSATGNKVNITSGNINAYGLIGGGYGTVTNNEVNISGGTVTLEDEIRGGEGTTVNNNTVNISGGTVTANAILGGFGSESSEGNTVNISGGVINANIFAAGLISSATNNAINIYGSPDLSNSYLYGYQLYYTDDSTETTISGNTLNLYTKGITAKNIGNFNAINFYLPESTVNGDTILTLTETSTDVSGAAVKAGVVGNANLNNGDIVTLLQNNGTITTDGTTYGTLSEGVSVTYDLTVKKDGDNKIIATIGSTTSDDTDTDTTNTDTTNTDTTNTDTTTEPTTPTATDDSNNVKNLYSTDSGTIYGGYTDSGNAQNNTVNLYSGSFENIYGGYAPNGSTSGNVLNVYNKNISAQNVSNFSAMNFYIPNDVSNGDTMLKLTDSAATDLSGVSIRAGVVAGNDNLAVGDTINLLQNPNGFSTDSATTYGTLTSGVSLDYGLNVSNGGSNILATVTSVPQKLNDVTKSVPLGGGLTSIKTVDVILDNNNLPDIGLNFDFESDSDDADAAEITDVPIVEPKGWEIFASAGGGSLRTKAGDGASVDMKVSSLDVGFARTLENGGAGKLSFAPIIDYAHGNYDSYLADGTHGTGSTKYIAGGGVFRNMWDNGFYVEGSFRIGKVRNDFASNDMDKVFGQRVSYDTKATAMAGHLKLGKNLRLNKNNLLDVYATYYHSHQGSMDATLAPYGDKYKISSANSGRFRIGYRMTTRTSKISRIYTGLAYQYEHASGITANYLAKDLSTASAGDSGSSGMLELGWQIKPLKNNPWMVDINTTGWIGHQRGITAMAKIQKSF